MPEVLLLLYHNSTCAAFPVLRALRGSRFLTCYRPTSNLVPIYTTPKLVVLLYIIGNQ
jgi:hypothetical protein